MWPSELPTPQRDEFALQQRPNLAVTPMDSGYTRTRAKFRSVPTHVPVIYRCEASRAALFEGFITHNLQCATLTFTTPLLFPSGMQHVSAKFLSNPLEQAKLLAGGQWWEYRATLEIDRPVLSSEDTQFLLDNDIASLNGVIDKIKEAITT